MQTNNGFWKFASEHPYITMFIISDALVAIGKTIRATLYYRACNTANKCGEKTEPYWEFVTKTVGEKNEEETKE